MNLQLPENKKDRQKILGVAGVLAVGALYAAWAFGYQPLVAKKAAEAERIVELEKKIQTAERQTQRTPRMQEDLRKATADVADYSERHMLHPRLGNYLLTAREILARHAEIAGLASYQSEETGLSALPAPRDDKQPAHTIQAYTVLVSLECSYDQLRHFIRSMEEDNPLLSISSVMISAQARSPQLHTVRMEIQWPVWIDPGMRARVVDQAAANRGDDA